LRNRLNTSEDQKEKEKKQAIAAKRAEVLGAADPLREKRRVANGMDAKDKKSLACSTKKEGRSLHYGIGRPQPKERGRRGNPGTPTGVSKNFPKMCYRADVWGKIKGGLLLQNPWKPTRGAIKKKKGGRKPLVHDLTKKKERTGWGPRLKQVRNRGEDEQGPPQTRGGKSPVAEKEIQHE